jgi:hypothetical protein
MAITRVRDRLIIESKHRRAVLNFSSQMAKSITPLSHNNQNTTVRGVAADR